MKREEFETVFSKIEPDAALKNRIMDRIEENEMKESTRKKTRHFTALAACVAVVGITTAFAAGNIISYFQNDNAVEITSMESLSQYNEEIGISSSNMGYTLTLDNLATDDNFLHVFYTVKSDEKLENDLWPIYRVDGKLMGFTNHNEDEGYKLDDYTYKGVMKLNVSTFEIPESFKFEMYVDLNEKTGSEFDLDYLYKENLNLTESDISKLLYVSTTAKKADIESKSIVKDINKKFEYINSDGEKDVAEISKLVISPFGNQFVIKDTHGADAALQVSGYALFDENGQSLDMLNSGFAADAVGKESINSFEFLKYSPDMKQLKLVPVKYKNNREADTQTQTISESIGTYPITYQTNDYGKIVVTNIRFEDGMIAIDYYKDGFSLYDPGFELMGANGENVEPGGKLGCTLYTRVHHDTNSYTAEYKYEKYDENGNSIPADESVSKENLEKSFVNLGIYKQNYFVLDYDNAITIDLK